MKPKTIILLVLAVGCGLVASYMTSRVIADRNTTPVEAAKSPVVYAKKNIAQGTLLKNPEEFFDVRMIPSDMVPRGKIITDLAALKDKSLINPLGADKHVTEDDLLSSSQSGLQYRIPPKMRAMSVKVTQDSSVGGFVLPNMNVDLVCVLRTGPKPEAKTILQNVLVLAVDNFDVRPTDGKNSIIATNVTLAVTPAQAEILSMATELGSLRLTLRSLNDRERVATSGVSPEHVTRNNDTVEDPGEGTVGPVSPPISVPVAPPPPEPVVVQQPPPAPLQPEPPPQPVIEHVMTVRNGQRVDRVVFHKDPEVTIQKRPAEGDAPKPQPAKRDEGDEPDQPLTAPGKDGKK